MQVSETEEDCWEGTVEERKSMYFMLALGTCKRMDPEFPQTCSFSLMPTEVVQCIKQNLPALYYSTPATSPQEKKCPGKPRGQPRNSTVECNPTFTLTEFALVEPVEYVSTWAQSMFLQLEEEDLSTGV